MLVGDHGEAFEEHPEQGHLGHGDWLFEQSVHIPLIFWSPTLFHGERDDRLVQQKDVAATLSWLAGDARPTLSFGQSVFFFAKPTESVYLSSHPDIPRGARGPGAWTV